MVSWPLPPSRRSRAGPGWMRSSPSSPLAVRLAVVVAAWSWSLPAPSLAVDGAVADAPHRDWTVLETGRFSVHFYPGEERMARRIEPRQAVQQALRVRVFRGVKHIQCRPMFDDFAGIHHLHMLQAQGGQFTAGQSFIDRAYRAVHSSLLCWSR